MKKKLLSALLSVAMVATLLVGCGSKTADTTTDAAADTTKTETTDAAVTKDDAATTDAAVELSNTGKTLRIYCWNDEFKSRLADYYPGYDKETDKIGDVQVEWVITPSQDNAYQNKLDESLLAQADAADEDKIDLFLIEADYALKYVNSDYSMDVKADLGLTDTDLAGQYKYTQDIATNADGALKAVTWQATPGLFAYRRSIAKDILGTDDPTEVQAALSDWDKFDAVAAQASAKGYKMLSGFDDSYRTFSNNVSGPWVQDNKIVIDDNITKWIDQTKTYTDNSYNNKSALWDATWAADQGPEGKVFGFFYSTWGINFTLLGNSLATSEADGGKAEVGNGIFGDYAVCQGPQSYYWGGTWLCGAAGTDNAQLVHDIMYTLTCDATVMKKITEDTQDYTNNQVAMEELANSDFKSDFLGGQNHIKLFAEAAKAIDMSNAGAYDQGLNESMQTSMHDYFNGTVTKEEALANFYKSAEEKYPELTH